ncbi:hypothetical protein KFL_002410160 [Klebsormidium nitens]|uniref:Uncharacterized protein n=1 Tax=Klebsormidium nitens TaxID=105231 RepID=A0A1Y1IA47_KLENI|nr:hypothetical protein KFL_002410160 [Klebsormidium nitens]|eukprot:GAQ85566.1 hypothetical protein KFL_002410160 [Klebsormidium nitens]
MKELVEPYVRTVLDSWIKVVEARAGNVPDEEQDALFLRDMILLDGSIKRDPGTAVLPRTLGPELGGKIVDALIRGDPRQVTQAEHYQLQRPHFRHWLGTRTSWDAATGELIDNYEIWRNVEEVGAGIDGALKVVQVNTHHVPPVSAASMNQGPLVSNSDVHHADGVSKHSSDSWSHYAPGVPFTKIPGDCGERFRLEFLFLAPDNRSRLGLAIAYDALGKASRVVMNRETVWGQEDEPVMRWSTVSEASMERNRPRGRLTGIEHTLSPDLLRWETAGDWKGYEHPVGSPLTGKQLSTGDYEVIHFPEGLTLSFPKFIETGMGAFHLSAHWARSERSMYQQTATYGADGAFHSSRKACYTQCT